MKYKYFCFCKSYLKNEVQPFFVKITRSYNKCEIHASCGKEYDERA